jgi:hypothetical protein
MRLLNVNTFVFSDFLDDQTRPRYAIASHRWAYDEATFKDVNEERNQSSAGQKKVEAFARYVRENLAYVDWLWIDTCCINKESDAELSYAINSMFKWYRNAEICIALLGSIETVTQRSSIGQDEWFRRGWTLQELLAPRLVVFVTKDWQVIGNKGLSSNLLTANLSGLDLKQKSRASQAYPSEYLAIGEPAGVCESKTSCAGWKEEKPLERRTWYMLCLASLE